MTHPARFDPKLKDYATETQKKYLEAVNRCGSVRAAARELDIHMSCLSRSLAGLKRRAAYSGYAPEADMTHPVPAPFVVKGTSTLYDEDGKAKLQWVKTSVSHQQAQQALEEWAEWLMKEAKGLSPLVPAPKFNADDLLCVYPAGDPHFGMYAWGAEAGDDFDLSIAETQTTLAVDRLVESSPAAKTAIILLLGDVFHANDQSNVTPGHKHQLDVDSRFPKVIMAGIRTFRHVILRALEKHQKVVVRIEPGNHDPQAKWALALSLAAYFDNNKRVEVDVSPSKFWFYRFGKVLLGSTHGDTVKHEGLPGVMASDRAEDWGATKFRYWYTGHVHTQAVREFPGVTCESFRTLAAKDAWTASHGYRAGRDMYSIVHHKDFGEIGRHRCDIAMIT